MADATTMTRKGQVTVPRDIRDRLGLESVRPNFEHPPTVEGALCVWAGTPVPTLPTT